MHQERNQKNNAMKKQLQKYLGINLDKQVKDLHHRNFKIFLKNGGDSRIWRDLCSWAGWINIVKLAILPKAIHRDNVILIEIPTQFFTGIGKNNLKFYMETKPIQGR